MRFSLLFLLTLLFSNTLFAQNTHSQNKILGISFYNHKASDFGITNAKNVVAFEQNTYYTKFMKEGFDLQYTDKFQLKKERITTKSNTHFFGDGSSYDFNGVYVYNKKYTELEKIIIPAKKSADNQEYIYKFDKKGRIIEKDFFRKSKEEHNSTYIKYNDKENTIEKYVLNKGAKHNVITFKTDKNGDIIEKLEKAKFMQPNDKKWFFEYDDKNNIIRAENGEITKKSIGFNTNGISVYKYNNKGLEIEENGNYSDTDFNIKNHYYYKYIYDKYGNWIGKYQYSTSYGYTDLSAQNYKNFTQIWLRKITYRNGDVTGKTTIKESIIQNYLEEVAENNPFKTKPIPKDGVYCSKPSEVNIDIYKNGTNINKHINYVKLIGNDYYLKDSVTEILYQLKDYTLKPIKKNYYKATVFADKDALVWFKSNKGLFTSFFIDDSYNKNYKTSLIYAKNNIDIILLANNVKKMVMLNAKNVSPNTVYTAIPYNSYLITHPNEDKKEVIPNGFVWKKNKKNQFWLYENKTSIKTKLIASLFFNHEIVYDSANNRSFFFREFTDKEPLKYFEATKLNGNVFWFKTAKGYGIFKNGVRFDINKVEYAQNGIDVIIYSKNDKKLYVLKDYLKSKTNQLIPVINYTDYMEKPSAEYVERKKMKDCKDDKKCYTNLFSNKTASILGDDSISNKEKALSNYMVKLYNTKPGILFGIAMRLDSEYLDLYIRAKKLLPQKIQDNITNSSRKMLNDYNKYINSKEVRDKVKKNGGTLNY